MFIPDQIRTELPIFPSDIPGSTSIKAYINYYFGECSAPPFHHQIGKFTSTGYELCAQIFSPNTPIQGNIILLHGLYTHTMANAPFICDLLRNGYRVFAYDLPGHGLSSGARCDIPNFSVYEKVFSDFLSSVCQGIEEPISVIAHSAGATGVMDYLNQTKEIALDRAILLAPLLRIRHFRMAKLGFSILRWFMKGFVSDPKKASATDHFIHRIQRDPLHNRYMPFSWLKAYFRWEKEKSSKTFHQPIVILQGEQDTTVDWHYNDAWFQKHAKHLQEFYFPKAYHHPLNEAPEVYEEILQVILKALRDSESH